MGRLNPPALGTTIPAFYGMSLRIPFDLNRATSKTDFNAVVVSIKTVQSGIEKMNWKINTYYEDNTTHTFYVNVNIDDYNKQNKNKKFIPQVGQYYKVQLALVNKEDDTTGYYSSIGVVKHTSEPTVEIQNMNEGNQQHRYTYTGIYINTEDITEKVYSYCFNLYNENNELVVTSGELIHDNSKDKDNDRSTDTWTVRKNLNANVKYRLEYNITTVNGLTKQSNCSILESETKVPNVHATLRAINNFDDGYITIKLEGDRSGILVNGKFILMRSSSEDNFDSWYELTKFDLANWSSSTDKIICKDHTIQQGVQYLYAIRAYNSKGLFSNRLKNIEGPIVADFEDAFLYDGERQLKIRFNPKVGTFKSTVLESKIDTIGGKFPFIFRNGNVEYKEFSISGLISLLSDANNEFLSNLPAAESEVIEESGHWLTTDNIRKEREFKMLVLSWLTNGKPKLFRSPTEGNFIIRLMNVSLSPNDTIGRVLHTFNCTAYEIAEFNFDNLKAYGFAMEDYIETRTLRIEQLNSNQLTNKVISMKSPAVYMSIVAEPGSEFEYYLQSSTIPGQVQIGRTGTYIFKQEVLSETPLVQIQLKKGAWTSGGSLTYGYYDTTVDNFSIVHDIKIKDQIIQVIGSGLNYNLIKDFSDIRLSPGAFHYIRIEPREIIKIYKENDNYYFNSNKDPVITFNKNCLYFIYNGFSKYNSNTGTWENPKLTDYYFDGREGGPKYTSPKLIKNLNYNFHITGMKEGSIVDFNGLAPSGTTGRYEALTNLSNISDMLVGDGLILDIVYQEKEIIYVVEVDGDYKNSTVIKSKNTWEKTLQEYQRLISINASSKDINDKKAEVDRTYSNYIYQLNLALEKIQEEYDVEYAL